MSVAIIGGYTDWRCPNCGQTDRTPYVAQPHSRLHTCPKLHMLSAPMLPVGTHAKVYAREREDYVGRELVQTDARGRPVMSVVTVRDEGQDAIVFAPTATGRAD